MTARLNRQPGIFAVDFTSQYLSSGISEEELVAKLTIFPYDAKIYQCRTHFEHWRGRCFQHCEHFEGVLVALSFREAQGAQKRPHQTRVELVQASKQRLFESPASSINVTLAGTNS